MKSIQVIPVLRLPALSRMRCIVLFLTALVLLGCNSRPDTSTASQSEAAFNANWTEKSIIHIPPPWVVVSSAQSTSSSIIELVLEGQTVDHWTDMITLISSKKDGQTVNSVLQHIAETAPVGCEAPPVLGVPNRFVDAGYPAAVQYVLCRKTKRWRLPEYFLYKTLEGGSGSYQILRSWRFTHDPGERQPLLSKLEIEGGLSILDTAHICDTSRPDRPCPPSMQRPSLP